MTEDELDLLASAYLDGEATPEEVAMVEREPQLLARVEALRAVSGQIAGDISLPDPAVKEQQLAAALAAFSAPAAPATDHDGAAAAGGAAPVIDLTQQRAERPRSATRSTTRTTKDSPRRSMPRWLPAAAALLLVGGAGAFVLSQGVGGDDSFEAADAGESSDEADATETAAVQAEDAASSSEARDADLDDSAMELTEDDAMADDAMEDEAMEDEEAMEEEAMEDEESEDAESGGTDESATTGGFFPPEPLLVYDEIPDPDQILLELDPSLRQDPAEANCIDFVIPEEGATVVGYAPVEVAGELAEFFVEVDGGGGERGILLASVNCVPMTP